MAAIKADQLGPDGAAIVAFLDLIAWSEGTSTSPLTKNDGYDVIVTGVDGPAIFTDYSDHPFAGGLRTPVLVRREPPLRSTAAGRYQILIRWWRSYKQTLNLLDFSPLSQDEVALKMMRERDAFAPLAAADLATAVSNCREIWASLPGNDYGQGGRTLAELAAKYDELRAQAPTVDT